MRYWAVLAHRMYTDFPLRFIFRMLSNVELASEKEVCEQPTKKIDKTEEVKKPRIQRKSQPSGKTKNAEQ